MLRTHIWVSVDFRILLLAVLCTPGVCSAIEHWISSIFRRALSNTLLESFLSWHKFENRNIVNVNTLINVSVPNDVLFSAVSFQAINDWYDFYCWCLRMCAETGWFWKKTKYELKRKCVCVRVCSYISLYEWNDVCWSRWYVKSAL